MVIHNLNEAKTTSIYHIEVIERKDGDAEWQILYLVHQMTITKETLNRSVIKPLKKGAVYPKSFNYALDIWRKKNDGAGGEVCHSSEVEYM